MNIRTLIAWACFAPGVLLIMVDIARLNITGLALLGLVFLAVWLWGIGVFRGDFWIADGPTDVSRLDRLDRIQEPLDLTTLTTDELEAVRQDRLDIAKAILTEQDCVNDPIARLTFDNAIDRHAEVVLELNRRAAKLAKSVGRTWPGEVA